MIPSWDRYFFNIIDEIATRSKDPNTQVGTVIVDLDNCIRATGYNSLPRKVRDNPCVVPERFIRPEKYFWMEHAERNAIYASARIGVPLKGCRIYLNVYPCMDCARAVIQAGLTEVIINLNKYSKWYSPQYTKDNGKVHMMLTEGLVDISFWDDALDMRRNCLIPPILDVN